jgi:hypothetical protein
MIEYDPQPPFDAGSVAKIESSGDADRIMTRVIEYAQQRQ